MNAGDILAELDRSILRLSEIRKYYRADDAFADGIFAGLNSFRRHIRSSEFTQTGMEKQNAR